VLRNVLPQILSCLQAFRRAVDAAFLLDKQADSQKSALCLTQDQTDQIEEVLSAAQICTRRKIPTLEGVQQERKQKVEQELEAVAQINDVLSSHNLPDVNSVDRERLKALVTRLRQQEQQLAFHRGLLHAQQKLSGPGGDYSAENFAFGSTPFPTWLALFTQEPVLAAILRAAKQAKLTVFGSSSGSLVFFAALALGLASQGIEILPFLHDAAEQTRLELQIPDRICRFVCADMLTVSVHDTSILLLTSQCWDTALHHQVQFKLEAELRPGALVLDYKNALQSSRCFRLAQQLTQRRVSWSSSQSLFIFERVNAIG
jgi:hypothetical protein